MVVRLLTLTFIHNSCVAPQQRLRRRLRSLCMSSLGNRIMATRFPAWTTARGIRGFHCGPCPCLAGMAQDHSHVMFKKRVLPGPCRSASLFHDCNPGSSSAVCSVIPHGSRYHRPDWRPLPSTWSLTMQLLTDAAPILAGCDCGLDQVTAADSCFTASPRCPCYKGHNLRVFGQAFFRLPIAACSVVAAAPSDGIF